MPSRRKIGQWLRLLAVLLTAFMLGACVPLQALRTPSPAPDQQTPGDDAPSQSEDNPVADSDDAAPDPKEQALTRLRELSATLERSARTEPADDLIEPQNLWVRARNGLRLSEYEHSAVKSQIAWYARHQHYLDRVAERAKPYFFLVLDAVEARDMPSEIALLPIVESAYQPFAYSHGRAAGLWQFVPGTGRRFGLKQTWWYDGRRDVVASTRAALDYLQYLHDQFDGDWLLALAAYNSGEGTVLHAIRKNRRRHRPTDFWHLDLPRETRGYVPRLLAISAIVADPQAHNLTLKPIPNEPVVTEVDVGSQIDLALAADLADLSIETLYRLNPGFNRWATDPNGPYRLLLPVDQADGFREQLAELPPRKRVHWERHRIRSGENLQLIAKRYRTTVTLLKEVNHIRGSMIRAGHSLIIPVAKRKLTSYRLSAEQRRLATQNRHRQGRSKVAYVVQEGDTLWDIARKYGVGVRRLAAWNAMAPTDPLLPGRRLVIWVEHTRKTASATPISFSVPPQKAIHRRIGYTVRSGDSLARISQRFRVSVNDLRRWNNLQRAKYLQPGQHLTVYVDVTRQSGRL
jgi:membrane-bound lytic murein transglycosylase D